MSVAFPELKVFRPDAENQPDPPRRLQDAGKLGSLAASEVIAHWGPRPMVRLEDLARERGLTL